ncbi:MAG TPA: ATP-binding protein [Candidatus Binatia bacterium]|nr:ATP-binding protein [Candidatus Binatia bacterium]
MDGTRAPLGTFVRRIAVRAVMSLAAIALLVVIGEFVIQQVIDRQIADSRVVNLAGRQRMLSQRLAKAALAAQAAREPAMRAARVAELAETTDVLERVHWALQRGDAKLALPGHNTSAVEEAFRALDPHLEALVRASRALVARLRSADPAVRLAPGAAELERVLALEPTVLRGMEDVVDSILGQEASFLVRMDDIVSQYEGEGRAHIAAVKGRQHAFVAATLAVVLFLGLGVLLPVIRELRRTIEMREAAEHVRLNESLLQASFRERERIGRDLHDGLGQLLAGIGMMMRVLAQRLAAVRSPEAESAAKIQGFVGEAIAQTRGLARALHPVDIADGGLVVALQALAEYASAAFGVRCDVRCEGEPSVSGLAATAHLYRIAQEAITNAVKHGKARRIAIAVSADATALRLSITDDGVGFAPDRTGEPGLGLGIMRDRAHLLGGHLEVAPATGGGTAVTARFDATAAARLAA